MAMRCYNVFEVGEYDIGGGTAFFKRLIDRVFYAPGRNAASIKYELVERGEYQANIWVQRTPRREID